MSHGCVSNARYIMIVDNSDEGNIRVRPNLWICVDLFGNTTIIWYRQRNGLTHIVDFSFQHSVEVRACTQISKGEEITDHYVTPLNGTMYRRSHLRDGWFFECQCQRCKDPTEFRTYCSSFLCPQKGTYILSQS